MQFECIPQWLWRNKEGIYMGVWEKKQIYKWQIKGEMSEDKKMATGWFG